MLSIRSGHPRALALFSLFAAGLAAACAAPKRSAAEQETQPVVRARAVRLYLSTRGIEGRYQTIAILRPSGDTTFVEREQVLAEMREQAASLGANGLLLAPPPPNAPGEVRVSDGQIAREWSEDQMVAILVRTETPAGQAMGPPLEYAPGLIPTSMVVGEQTPAPPDPSSGPSFEEWLEAKRRAQASTTADEQR